MENLYILLTRSQTIASRLIHLATDEPYTHSSLAFDPRLETLCSFARYHEKLPMPAGLVRESLWQGYYHHHGDTPCELLMLPVEDDVFMAALKLVGQMFTRRRAYRYSIMGLEKCRRGIPEEREDYFFCSQFVGEILRRSGAARLPKEPSLMHPADFCGMPEMTCVYRGSVEDLADICRRRMSVTPRAAAAET